MPGYERDERGHEPENSGGSYGAIIGLVAAGIGALVAAMSLQSVKERNYDNELQREHEREMARQSETNPNIRVQTGRVTIEHNHHGETSQFTPAALRNFENHGLKALNRRFD